MYSHREADRIETARVIDWPEGINMYRLLTLRAGLKMELSGLRKRGQSCYSIVKAELGFKGNKRKVMDQLCDYIVARQAPAPVADVAVLCDSSQ